MATAMRKLVTVAAMLSAVATAMREWPGVHEPGYCWRFVRLMLEGQSLLSPGAGLDAKQAARWYQRRGLAIEHDGWENTRPGDVVFWLHGLHGHVGVRVKGNQIAENSSVHSTAGSDARGLRRISHLQPPDIVVRFTT